MTRRPALRRRMSMRRAFAALGLLWVVLSPASALAHAALLATDPANDAVVAAAPPMLTLTFDEPVEPLAIRLVDAAGAATGVTQIARRGNALLLTVPDGLSAGAHVVSWRVISADGHPVGGSFVFWVGQRGGGVPDVVRSDQASLRVAIWLARLLIHLGLFVGVGGAFVMAWIAPTVRRKFPAAVCGVTGVVGLLALGLSVGLQGVDALGGSLSALALPAAWRAGLHGSFGWAVVAAAVALLLALTSQRSGARLARALTSCALIGVGLALAVSGHAASAPPRWLSAPAVFLHGASLAFWIGALLPLADALTRGGDSAVAVLMRFSRWIPFAVAALLASGLAIALVQVPQFAALWTTDYGRVLSVKLALVAVLLAIALWNRVVLTPQIAARTDARAPQRMRRAIWVELTLVVAILGVVGLWRFTPPPRAAAAAADHFFVHLHTTRVMANVTITPGQAGPVEIAIELETPDEKAMLAKGVSVTLSRPDLGIEPVTVDAQPGADGSWQAYMSAPVPGRWVLRLGVLVSDFEKVDLEAPILIE